MSANKIDAALLARMFLAGAKNLELKKEWINELNVFPVPDGDTGTNMTMTIMSAVKEVQELDKITVKDLAKAIASGALRGARGNSGVILSQLLRGFTKAIRDEEEIDAKLLAAAAQKAVETAYKAVMKPKEGTILTVAKGVAEKAAQLSEEDMELSEFLGQVLEHARQVLEQTPEMLPVLKEAGVVDSGGQGLVTVLEGACDAFLGKEIPLDFSVPSTEKKPAEISGSVPLAEADIKYGYCTEFIILLTRALTDAEEQGFKEYLMSIGDSVVLVADEEIVKVHVHTNDPGLAIQKALTFGALTRMKIDNMREEHHERVIKNAEKLAKEQEQPREAETPLKEVGFISVSVGDGFNEIFKGLDVDYLIEGGQTMNPSTEDMLNAIRQVPAKTIFIYPNNKNIILAANQAAGLTKDKKILVIPTKTIPQGITAIINYAPEKSAEENAEIMGEMIRTVRTGQVTYAVRDTHIDDKEIRQGDIMAVGDSGILAVGQDILTVSMETVDAMMKDEAELISIYYGEGFSGEEAEKLGAMVSEKYPDCDVEVNEGGQPVYYCIISVE